jgi:hypothetical protein
VLAAQQRHATARAQPPDRQGQGQWWMPERL